jgi:hypothetical protein
MLNHTAFSLLEMERDLVEELVHSRQVVLSDELSTLKCGLNVNLGSMIELS